MILIPFSRLKYDRDGEHNPDLGEDCYRSPARLVMCGNPAKVLTVRNPLQADDYGDNYYCCCPDICEGLASPDPVNGICHCFAGKIDFTNDVCNMSYAASVGGPAVGEDCSGPWPLAETNELGEAGGEGLGVCYWRHNTGNIGEEDCPERCDGYDNQGVPREKQYCRTDVRMVCAINPCGDREYLAILELWYTHIELCDGQPCGYGDPSLNCISSCQYIPIYIPSDLCGCPEPGTWGGYPWNDPSKYCSFTFPEMNCDPLPPGPRHTITITKIHGDDCKPQNCAKPPCAIGEEGSEEGEV